MAIEIVGFDDLSTYISVLDPAQTVITLVLSRAPGKSWITTYDEQEIKLRKLKITTVVVDNRLAIYLPSSFDPEKTEEVIKEVQTYIDATNKLDDAFQEELSKLKSPKRRQPSSP